MRRILLVDCFDSFTYNLFHYLDELNNGGCVVVRYDKFLPEDALSFSHVVLSPGPGLPGDYPLIKDYLNIKHPDQVLLGVCLGHQYLAGYYGGALDQLNNVRHGVSSEVFEEEESLVFKGINWPIEVGHYHSWVVSSEGFPLETLKITSKTKDGIIMSFEHKKLPLFGLQFHPESVMTPQGKRMLKNWLEISK